MTSLKEIITFLDDILEVKAFPHDYSNNGLQFQGVNEVKKAVFAVDACEAVFTIAADLDADFVFTHHGISWGPGIKRINGITARRVAALAANGISLYAAHLPLDANPLIGHNALIANMLGLQDIQPFAEYHDYRIGWQGTLKKPLTLEGIAKILDKKLPSEGDFTMIGNTEEKITRVGVISGGGAFQEAFEEIHNSDIECLVTGEMQHQAFHTALETGTQVLAMGHYRTETPGVIAVMNSLQEKFNLETEFIDVPTGL